MVQWLTSGASNFHEMVLIWYWQNFGDLYALCRACLIRQITEIITFPALQHQYRRPGDKAVILELFMLTFLGIEATITMYLIHSPSLIC